ncbi:hypothetical protein KY348_01100 [Candidatus Woesearchaeota archaeon]|nr:hypothetical protein [Candidatus Woesearchaeota archaeon]
MQPGTELKKAEKKSSLEKIISSAKKFFIIGSLIGTLSLNPWAGDTQKKEDPFQENKERTKRFSFFWDVNLGYRSSILGSVENIPLEVRDVPKHEDDWYAKDRNVAPIEKNSVNLYGRVKAGTRLGGKLAFIQDKLFFKTGVGIDFTHAAALSKYNKRKDMQERNYTNFPGTNTRGYGAALTFYQVRTSFVDLGLEDAFFRPLVFSEIEVKLEEKTGLVLGYLAYPQNFHVRNGWDRYDNLQVKDEHELAKLIIGGPYVSIKFYHKEDYSEKRNYVSIDVGFTSILKKQLTEIGKNMQLNFNDGSFYIGISQSIHWE